MPLGISLVMLGFGGFGAWQFWRGLKLGKVAGRIGDADRTNDPISFWILFPIYGFGALLLLSMALFLLIGSGFVIQRLAALLETQGTKAPIICEI